MRSWVREKKLAVEKVVGTENPGDIGTKALASSALTYLMREAGIMSSAANQVATVCVTIVDRHRHDIIATMSQ